MNDRPEELLQIVAELSQKYTGYESTSVTYEKAQMLMEAVLYCLEEYDRSGTDSLIRKEIPVREKYDAGLQLVLQKAENTAGILNQLSACFEDYGVQCLYDTVQKAIPEFLKWYNARFCPQDTIIQMDYPLLADISQSKGVDTVYGYLRSIRTEQRFLHMFARDYVVQVLETYDPNYREMLDNICSIVLTNTVGHLMLQKPLAEMGFREEEYQLLAESLQGKAAAGLTGMAKQLITEIARQFFEDESEMAAYLCCDAENMAVRIETAVRFGTLDRIFLV